MHLKKIIKTKIVCLLFFASVSAYSQPFGGGSGTEQDPYQLSTLAHLEELSGYMLSVPVNYRDKHYILMNDITDTLRVCMGGSINPTGFFAGVFDGQGYSITLGLNSCPPGQILAFIPAAIDNFVIKNLTVNGYVATDNISGSMYMGGIVGAVGLPVNTSASDGYIINCINNAKIYGRHDVGGILGCVLSGKVTIDNCINLSEVSNYFFYSDNRVGGIVGNVAINTKEIIIRNSINYGFVKGTGFTGGILGGCNIPSYHSTSIILENNFNSGVVQSNGNNVGCIIGKSSPNTILINNHYDKQMCGEED